MRSKEIIKTVKLKDGEYLEKEFDNYRDMAKNAVDWILFCSYQLQPNISKGIYKILQLSSMQIASSSMSGGIMFDFVIPKDCITFSVMIDISQKASIDQMKLKTGMIAILDDTKIYNFMCSENVEFVEISLNKNANPTLIKRLIKDVDRYYIDDIGIGDTLVEIIDKFSHINLLDNSLSKEIEENIIKSILNILDNQEAKIPYFTKSEKIVMKIKRKLFKHMDHTMSMNSFSKEYGLSTKSIQNSFKSLFGILPNQFIRLLKLNLVHHELVQSKDNKTTVQRVAKKWGFSHMGRFAKYYKELFKENPSFTLKANLPIVDGMREDCVERKEEM